MQPTEISPFIPSQQEGKELDVEHSVTKSTSEDAGTLYRLASKRLLQPFLWQQLAGSATAEFNIYANHKNDNCTKRPVKINDHLFIDIPANEILNPETHDWVIVEDIKQQIVKDADESIGLKLRACPDPSDLSDKTSHFFTSAATSTFIIQRTGREVKASYHGRNEKPNIETGDTGTNIRNGMVALGAVIGLSKLQWTALLKGLLSDPQEDNHAEVHAS